VITLKRMILMVIILIIICSTALCMTAAPEDPVKTSPATPLITSSGNLQPVTGSATAPPTWPVKLIFLHHSSGENWLKDNNGGLGLELRENNYFVSDTNYDWGPVPEAGSEPIGSYTDIGNWWTWFRGPKSPEIMDAVYEESGQHSSYSRLKTNPGGKNRIIMFKSCYPNSNLGGNPGDPVPPIDANLLKGLDSGSEYHTVANA
jgi:hypothetical protein